MTFKLVTWNIENFSKKDDQGKPNARYAAKLEYISKRVNELNPDVVALQEVLDEDALAELAARTDRQAFAAPPDGRGNRVAFLARRQAAAKPIVDYRLERCVLVQRFDEDRHVECSPELRRPFLALIVEHAGGPITILNAHLKSKLQTFPGGGFTTTDEALRAGVGFFDLVSRAAEAATLRAHATELLKVNTRVIVCGDLNDTAHAATTEILYGPPGSQLSKPEDAQDEGSGFSRADQGDTQRLFNITKLVPEAQRWTRITSGVREQLDHILCSEGLLPRRGKLRSVPTVSILNEQLQPIGEQPRKDSGIPDHAAITASFDLDGAK
jgi:endonuclease/exonuclease/phosphatase family metal-dependent hydrolase